MFNLPSDSIVLIAIVITSLAVILYLREYFQRKRTSETQTKISQATRQKSMQLLTAAEIAETQILAEGKFATLKLEEEFKQKLNLLLDSSTKSVSDAQNELTKFITDLKNKSDHAEQISASSREQRINTLFENLETRLSDFLVTTEQKTTSSIELELKATRQLIDTYKAQQLKLIDENIVAMMEQTLNIVLGKKLSLKDQIELIYEALERAKVDKFII